MDKRRHAESSNSRGVSIEYPAAATIAACANVTGVRRGTGDTSRVRTKPLVGRKAWFGPRRFGWGLTPVTAEGWAVVVIAVAAIMCWPRSTGMVAGWQ